MSKPTQQSQIYLKFLSLVKAIRELPDFPELDAIEARLLEVFAPKWQAGEKFTVLTALLMLPDVSQSTIHRRLKSLRSKGLIAVDPDAADNRVKYVLPTSLCDAYFTHLGTCIEEARKE